MSLLELFEYNQGHVGAHLQLYKQTTPTHVSYQELLCFRDLSEISRGEGVETEGGSQLFESAEKGGVMKNGPLKGGGSCKYVSVIM